MEMETEGSRTVDKLQLAKPCQFLWILHALVISTHWFRQHGGLLHEYKPRTLLPDITECLVTMKDIGITLQRPLDLALVIYADASYGGGGARSQPGALMTLGDQPVGWYSRRPDTVSSITVTFFNKVKEVITHLDAEHVNTHNNTRHFVCPHCGNVFDPQTHLEPHIKQTQYAGRATLSTDTYHYLRQQAQREKLIVKTTPGKDNPPDILTPMGLSEHGKLDGWGRLSKGGVANRP